MRVPFYGHGVLVGWRLYTSGGLFGAVLVGIEYKNR